MMMVGWLDGLAAWMNMVEIYGQNVQHVACQNELFELVAHECKLQWQSPDSESKKKLIPFKSQGYVYWKCKKLKIKILFLKFKIKIYNFFPSLCQKYHTLNQPFEFISKISLQFIFSKIYSCKQKFNDLYHTQHDFWFSTLPPNSSMPQLSEGPIHNFFFSVFRKKWSKYFGTLPPQKCLTVSFFLKISKYSFFVHRLFK